MTNLEKACAKRNLTSDMIKDKANAAATPPDPALTTGNVDLMLDGTNALHAEVKLVLEAWNINQDIIENIA